MDYETLGAGVSDGTSHISDAIDKQTAAIEKQTAALERLATAAEQLAVMFGGTDADFVTGKYGTLLSILSRILRLG